MSGPGIIAGMRRIRRYVEADFWLRTRSTSTASTIGKKTIPGRKMAVKIRARRRPLRTSGSENASV